MAHQIEWSDERPTAPGDYWLSVAPRHRLRSMGCVFPNRVALVLPRDTPNYWRTWELLTKQLPLVSLVLVVLLSGCLTASKIHRWESALVGWARKGKPECVESAKVASKYLVNANRTLQGATSANDLAADGEAKKLMTEAAVKCGEVVP